jgi:hypothetical protein
MPRCAWLRDTILGTGAWDGDDLRDGPRLESRGHTDGLRGPHRANQCHAADGGQFRCPVLNVVLSLAAYRGAERITVLFGHGREGFPATAATSLRPALGHLQSFLTPRAACRLT